MNRLSWEIHLLVGWFVRVELGLPIGSLCGRLHSWQEGATTLTGWDQLRAVGEPRLCPDCSLALAVTGRSPVARGRTSAWAHRWREWDPRR